MISAQGDAKFDVQAAEIRTTQLARDEAGQDRRFVQEPRYQAQVALAACGEGCIEATKNS